MRKCYHFVVLLVVACWVVASAGAMAAPAVKLAHVTVRPHAAARGSASLYQTFAGAELWRDRALQEFAESCDDTPAQQVHTIGAGSSSRASASGLRRQYIVVFKLHAFAGVGGIREHLERSYGVEALHYLPDNSFAIFGTEKEVARIAKADGVLWVGEFKASYKVSSSLLSFTQSIPVTREAFSQPARMSVVFSSRRGARSALSTLAGDLGEHLGCAVRVERMGEDAARITLPHEHAVSAVKQLAKLDTVHWIERAEEFRTLNKFAHAILQSGHNVVAANNTPIWERGLQGQGQVVGCGDTGLDYDHCFFYDPSVTVKFNQAMPTHRKIASYSYFSDSDTGDEAGGHGTHVVGSILGVPRQTSNSAYPFRGSAPGARVAFFDLQDASGGSGLYIPADVENDYFHVAYGFGARLHSNSWGSSSNSYTATARAADNYVYTHPDLLPLFANGNAGEDGRYSVSSPATAKNVLSIGAEQNTYESFVFTGRQAVGVAVQTAPTVLYPAVRAAFGPTSLTEMTAAAVIAQPVEACSTLTNGAQISGKVAVIKRGTCAFVDKVQNAQNAGAIAVIVYNNVDGANFQMGGTSTTITIQAVLIHRLDGEALVSRIGATSTVVTTPSISSSAHTNMHNLADFSSRGPTFDMRLKPDVVAPGQMTVSSYGSGSTTGETCGLVAYQGTSMATPTAAGGAALVRQYFTEGFYPGGTANASNSMNPSAALLKAMMIQSAVVLGGLVANVQSNGRELWQPLLSRPNYDAGFGRVQLDSALRFSTPLHDSGRGINYSPSPFQLIVHDNGTVAQGDAQRYCFEVVSNPHALDFKATVVWTDPPATTNAQEALVNNLDVTATINGTSTVVLGNSHTEMMSSTQNASDVINNVEQVWLPASNITATEVVCVNVIGVRVTTASQKYALVVTGPVTEVSSAGTILCPAGCSGNGACHNGVCSCNQDYYGADCGRHIDNVPEHNVVQQALFYNDWAYFQYECNSTETCSVRVNMNRTSSSGDPDVYVRRNAKPTLSEFDYRDIAPDTAGGEDHYIFANQNGEMSSGVLYIGVFGTCCDNTAFALRVDRAEMSATEEEDGGGSSKSKTVPVVLGLLGGIVLVLAVFNVVKYLKRRQQSGYDRQGDTVEMRGIPVGAPVITSPSYPVSTGGAAEQEPAQAVRYGQAGLYPTEAVPRTGR